MGSCLVEGMGQSCALKEFSDVVDFQAFLTDAIHLTVHVWI
jgi:hypothetical protein